MVSRDLLDDSNQKYRGKRSLSRSVLGPMLRLCSCCGQQRGSNSPKLANQQHSAIARTRRRRTAKMILVYVTCPLLIIVVVSVQRLLSLYMGHRKLIPAPIAHITRDCPTLSYVSITDHHKLAVRGLQINGQNEGEEESSSKKTNSPLPVICITTLTDHASPSTLQRFIRWRNFDSILNLTMTNKQSYVDSRPNYYLFDGSHLIDSSRPPAWTKVKAMQFLLEDANHPGTPHCDWIVWMDADTVIMNPEISWEDFLPETSTKVTSSTLVSNNNNNNKGSQQEQLQQQSLVIGTDKGGGYNSGVFCFRNTPWTRDFLQTWWDMTDFVRPPGFALSGDNASLKYYLAQLEKSGEFQTHVVVPPRCRLNSFAVLLSPSKYVYAKDHLEEYRDTWYMSSDYYHKGDFIAHFPGIDNKEEVLKMFLDLASTSVKAHKTG